MAVNLLDETFRQMTPVGDYQVQPVTPMLSPVAATATTPATTPASTVPQTSFIPGGEASAIEEMLAQYLTPANTPAQVNAINAEVNKAIQTAGEKIKSEAAARGGLYSGGYLGALAEATATGELEKSKRIADLEDKTAEKQQFGITQMIDLYKTNKSAAIENAKMAQQAGQFEEQMAWERESMRLDQEFKASSQQQQIDAQKELAEIQHAYDLEMAEKQALEKELDRAWQSGENEKARKLQLQIADKEAALREKEIKAQKSSAKMNAWGSALGGISGLIGGMLLKS